MTEKLVVEYGAFYVLPDDNVWPRDDQGDCVVQGYGERPESSYPVHIYVDTSKISWASAVALLRKVADTIEANGYPEWPDPDEECPF